MARRARAKVYRLSRKGEARQEGERGQAAQETCAHHPPHDFIWLVVWSIWSAEVTTLEFIS